MKKFYCNQRNQRTENSVFRQNELTQNPARRGWKFRLCTSATLLTIVLGSMPGCFEKSVAPAIARNSQFSPKFDPDSGTDTEFTTGTTEYLGTLAYLNRDHFACIKIPLAKLKSVDELKAVPWQDLNESLTHLVGPEQDVSQIQNLYVIMDGQFLKIDEFETCIGFLIEFSTNVSPVTEERSSKSDEKNIRPVVRRKLTETLIACGTQEIIDKLKIDASSTSEIAERLAKSESNDSISGAITLRPIRSTLRGLLSMLATMQPAMKSLAHIPDDIESIWFSLNIADTQQFFDLEMDILNDDLRMQIVESIDQAISSSFDVSQFATSLPAADESMSMPQTPKTLMSVFKEILDRGLLTTDVDGQRLDLKISRPQELDQLVANIVEDYSSQAALQNRLDRANQVAGALKAYFDDHGVLPPLGPVADGSELPAQFNWRVGVSKYLGGGELYRRFDFQKSWDDPINIETAEEVASQFRIHSFEVSAGENRLYQNLQSKPNLKIEDNKNWTAVVVEIDPPLGNWTKPPSEFKATNLEQIGHSDENGIVVITASFDVRILKRSSGKTEAFFGVQSGERLKSSDFIKFQ